MVVNSLGESPGSPKDYLSKLVSSTCNVDAALLNLGKLAGMFYSVYLYAAAAPTRCESSVQLQQLSNHDQKPRCGCAQVRLSGAKESIYLFGDAEEARNEYRCFSQESEDQTDPEP